MQWQIERSQSMIVKARPLRALTLAFSLAALAACTSVDLKEPAKIENRDGTAAAGTGSAMDPNASVSGVAPVVVQETDPLNDPASPWPSGASTSSTTASSSSRNSSRS
jgi:hypothetical protein